MKTEPVISPRLDATDPADHSGLIDIAALIRAAGEDEPRPRYDERVLAVGAPPVGSPMLSTPAQHLRRERRRRARRAVPVLAAALVLTLGATAAAQWMQRTAASTEAAPFVPDRAAKPSGALAPPSERAAEPDPVPAEVAVPGGSETPTVEAPAPSRDSTRPPALRRVVAAPAAQTPAIASRPESARPPAGDFAALAASEAGSAGPTAASSDLPSLPSRTDVSNVLRPLSGRIARCAEGDGTVAMARIVIEGPTGRVTRASVDGSVGGTDVGACVAGILDDARFAPFERTRFEVTFPYRL